MCIKFNVLKELGVIASGDPILCQECGACFNKHSILYQKDGKNFNEKCDGGK